jgi:predicted secreted hydrolase
MMQLDALNPTTGKVDTFIVQPAVADQELTGRVGGLAYWEGACRVLDANHKEIGRAYMELTGYAKSMKGKF